MVSSTRPKSLTLDTINPAVLDVEYAVRGELAIKADEYTARIERGEGGKLGFDKVVTANIGNPQQKGLDQRPITFWRQVSFLSKRRADGSRSEVVRQAEVQRFGARWKEKSREKREERRERREERKEKREEGREKREERRGRREECRLFFVHRPFIVHSSSIHLGTRVRFPSYFVVATSSWFVHSFVRLS
jgi:hypothetical protein